MYYFAGGITMAWGIALWWALPPDPVRARGFNERERYILVARLRSNNAGVRNTHLKTSQIWELLLDAKFWVVFAISFLSMIANGPISTFVPIIIHGLGFSELNSLLLKMPTGAYAGTVQLLLPYLAFKFTNIRTYLICVAQVGTVVAALLLWLLPTSNTGGLLFAIIILPSVGAGYAVLMGLVIANTAGYTKKSVASSGMYIGYCLGKRVCPPACNSTRRLTLHPLLGNFVGPLVFTPDDAPRYPKGFIIVVVASIVALLLSLVYRFLCIASNRRRDKEGHEESFDHAYDDDLTDKTVSLGALMLLCCLPLTLT